MSEKAPCKPGDWVRFYRDAKLVIGVVAYVKRHRSGAFYWDVSTDIGETNEENLYEVRSRADD